MMDYFAPVLMLIALLNISIWPPLIYFQNREIIRAVNRLVVVVSDDPDPGADEDEPVAETNVVAIGKRAA